MGGRSFLFLFFLPAVEQPLEKRLKRGHPPHALLCHLGEVGRQIEKLRELIVKGAAIGKIGLDGLLEMLFKKFRQDRIAVLDEQVKQGGRHEYVHAAKLPFHRTLRSSSVL